MTRSRRILGGDWLGHVWARVRRPDARFVGMAVPVGFALLVLAVAATPSLRDRLAWVPVANDNSVVDAFLAVSLGIVFLVVAAVVVLPIALAIHQAGHAVGARLVEMRVLAVRIGPVLVEPQSPTGHVTRLPLRDRDDLLVAWSHLDDSPLPAWGRPRGWLVALASGPVLNLAVSFVCAMWSPVASPMGYVLLREMVWVNLAVCVVALLPIPIRRLGVESDGVRLLTLVRNGDEADALIERLRDEVVAGPTRPAAWPRERLTAWETKIRRMPVTAERRDEQLELGVYLMLHALDRGDRDGAWQWSQALQALLGAPATGGSMAADVAGIVLAVHAARWDRELDTARRHLDRIAPTSAIAGSPWHTVAAAAVAVGEAQSAGDDRDERLGAAPARAEKAVARLTEPAKLHGIDQLLRGIAQAVAADADVERQRLAYAVETAEAA